MAGSNSAHANPAPENKSDATSLRRTLALVLAGGRGTRLGGLTRTRAKPVVPFGGNRHLVDFTLSNCVNSRIDRIALLTQYCSDSVVDHISQNWQGPASGFTGSVEVWPARERSNDRYYRGTADAVFKNLDRIEAFDPDDVLIVSSDHVYAMDYRALCAGHAANLADVTIGCIETPASESSEFGIIEVDEASRINAFVERPDWPVAEAAGGRTALASMGVYVFNTDYLIECLEADAGDPDSRHDFSRSIMPRVLAGANVHAHRFLSRDGSAGYWRAAGTVDRYWRAHQDLLGEAPKLDLASAEWPIYGCRRERAPARLASTAHVTGSLIAAGSYVSGTVEHSVLSTDCLIDDGAMVSLSVLLPHSSVGRNCVLDRVVLDSYCHVPDDTVISARTVGRDGRFEVTPDGVVLVTADALVRRMVRERPMPRSTAAAVLTERHIA